MSDFVQGLYVTAFGMGLVFASLGLLMLIIVGLQHFLHERPAVQVRPPLATPPAPSRQDTPEEVVAAIAVALAVLRARQQAPAPPQTTVITLPPGSAAWRASGRLTESKR